MYPFHPLPSAVCCLPSFCRLPSAVCCLFLCCLPSAVYSANYSVNQGLRFYEQGNYDAALVAFEEAEKQAPNDFRITYNQACTYLAAGRTAEAIEKFRRTAFAPDRNLVYESLLSLGNIAVDQAESYLAKPPENTTPGHRRNFHAELLVAEREFVDAIDILPGRTQAKENLESIRQWKSTLDTLWKQNDQKKRAETLTAAEHLSRIEQSQQTVYRKTAAETLVADSPKKFQSLYLIAKEQGDLIQEIELLWEKFQAEYSLPDRPRLPSDDREGNDHFSLEKTEIWFEDLTRHIANSTNRLESYDGRSAKQFQVAALEMLDTLQNGLRDYSQLVRLAAMRQSNLVVEADKPDCDFTEILWKQRLVYHNVLLFLKDAYRETSLSVLPTPISDEDDLFRETGNSPEELLRQSQQTALAVSSELEYLFNEIFVDLEDDRLGDAPLNLRRVRELLRKIVEPLDEIPKSSPFSGNTGSRNSASEEDFFGESEEDDTEEKESESGDSSQSKTSEKPSSDSKESQGGEADSDNRSGKSGGGQESLDELVDSFKENLASSGEEQNSASASNRATSQRSSGGENGNGNAEPTGGSAKSESQVDSRQSFPRRPQVADYNPYNRNNLTPEEAEILRTAQEQANVLIRTVKRRQQDAEKFRNQIRQLFETPKEREPKDW